MVSYWHRQVKQLTKRKHRQIARGTSRMPENSLFYEKLLPALLIVLAIIMLILILFAIGVLVGVVPLNPVGGVIFAWLNWI
jgi:hypothetical protein